MYRRLIAAGPMAAFLAGTSAAAAAEPVVLEPTTQWRIDYGDERCSLLRQFGTVQDGVLLEIASFGSRSNFRITLIGKPLPKSAGPSGMVKLRFTPDTEDRETMVLRGTVADKRPAALFSSKFTTFDEDRERISKGVPNQERLDMEAMPEPPEADFEEQTTDLRVTFAVAKQVTLHTGKMTKPLAALRTCIDSLETAWGLDPAKQRSLSRRAVLVPSTIKAIQGNYPASMVVSGLSAYVPVRVMVDAEGNAGACVVQSDNVDSAFQKAVCDGLAKKFKPALDAQENPVASIYTTAVIFRLN